MKKSLITIILILQFGCGIILAQTDIISTVVGTGSAGFSGDGGQAISAKLNGPEGIAFDSNGNMYIADAINNRIRKVTTSGVISTVVGTGLTSPVGDGGQATSATLYAPLRIKFDSQDNMYIVDEDHFCIRKINVSSGIITTIAGIPNSGGFSGDGGQATAAKLLRPYGMDIDALGNLYIADTQNHRIRKVNTSGIITTIAGTGTAGYSGDGGQAILAELNNPEGILVDNSGNLYIADTQNNIVRKINASGIITTIAGNGTAGYSGDGGQATLAMLNKPTDMYLINQHLYVSNTLGHSVRLINSSGIISTVAGTGAQGFSGDGGLATSAQLDQPTMVAFDAIGNFYISDYGNNRIRKVSNREVGIEKISISNLELNVFPNPASDILQIELNNCKLLKSKAVDVLGREFSIPFSSNSLDLSLLQSGTYVIQLETDKGLTINKIIKK